MPTLPFTAPLEPMLAKAATALPTGEGWLFDPKWDGFRALVFVDDDGLLLQSRDTKPLNRYFPELEAALAASLKTPCVLDGEIVIVGTDGLDFDALLQRIHPAASRVQMLAKTTPASFVAWDLLALGTEDLRELPLEARRAQLEKLLSRAAAPLYLSPVTREVVQAQDWFDRFEGAGLDGVMAKRADSPYRAGERTMLKLKHKRTADCVVAGFRWHKNGQGTLVGSLLLGLFDAAGVLHHVGVTAAFTTVMRKQLVTELAPLREHALERHPWGAALQLSQSPQSAARTTGYESAAADSTQRMPGATSRWSAGKDLGWEPLRPERVCEVAFDQMQGDRLRHGAQFVRWRPDKPPEQCRYDQLEVAVPYELKRVFGAG